MSDRIGCRPYRYLCLQILTSVWCLQNRIIYQQLKKSIAKPNKNHIFVVKTTLSLTGSCVGSGGKVFSRGWCGNPRQAQAQKPDPLTVVSRRAPTSQRWWDLGSYPSTRHPSLRHRVVLMRCVLGDRSFLKRHRSNDITLSRGRVCNITDDLYSHESRKTDEEYRADV